MNEYVVLIETDSGEHLRSIHSKELTVTPNAGDIVEFNGAYYKVLQRVLARWAVRLYVRELINSQWA